MRKLILFAIFAILLTSLVAAAPTLPMPIYGNVKYFGEYKNDLTVRITNLATGEFGEIKTMQSTDAGYYQLTLNDISPEFRAGDQIKIEVVECGEFPTCKQIITLTRNTEVILANFDIADKVEAIESLRFVCWDGTITTSEIYCPIQPVREVEVEITKYICPDGQQVDYQSQCPPNSYAIALEISIVALLIIAGTLLYRYKWGKGFLARVNKMKAKGDAAKARGDNKEAEFYYKRAEKMLSTSIRKAKEGNYK